LIEGNALPKSLVRFELRIPTILVVRLVFFVTLPMLVQVASAERLEPPLRLLYNPLNVLVSGKVDEINPQGRIVFARQDVLSAKTRPPELIDVKVPTQILADVKIGETYLLAYSSYVRDPRKPEALIGSTVGPVLIVSEGLEPALFRDTAEMRKLLKLGRSEHALESRSSLDLLLAALKSDDPQLQNLAAAQITMEPELLQRIKPTDLPAIKALLANDRAHPAARARLLVAANRHPEQLGREWPAEMALAIITTTPIDLNLTKTLDSGELVLSAFDIVSTLTSDLPLASIVRWIGSTNPGIAERALLIVRKQAPDQERAAIQHALDDSSLAPLTRQFLQDHLRRLNLSNDKVHANATDSQKILFHAASGFGRRRVAHVLQSLPSRSSYLEGEICAVEQNMAFDAKHLGVFRGYIASCIRQHRATEQTATKNIHGCAPRCFRTDARYRQDTSSQGA
jgi:hypothetical protein